MFEEGSGRRARFHGMGEGGSALRLVGISSLWLIGSLSVTTALTAKAGGKDSEKRRERTSCAKLLGYCVAERQREHATSPAAAWGQKTKADEIAA